MWPGFFMRSLQNEGVPTSKQGLHKPCESGTIELLCPPHRLMKKAKLQAATVGGTPDDIAQAFYEALHNADIQQLMACWAEEDEIVCVHPGGPRLIGAGAIRQAFEAMFSNGSVQAHPDRSGQGFEGALCKHGAYFSFCGRGLLRDGLLGLAGGWAVCGRCRHALDVASRLKSRTPTPATPHPSRKRSVHFSPTHLLWVEM